MNNEKKEKIKLLLKKNMVIPCLFFYFVLIFIVNGFKDMTFAPWVIFTVASLGFISLIVDSFKILRGTYKE